MGVEKSTLARLRVRSERAGRGRTGALAVAVFTLPVFCNAPLTLLGSVYFIIGPECYSYPDFPVGHTITPSNLFPSSKISWDNINGIAPGHRNLRYTHALLRETKVSTNRDGCSGPRGLAAFGGELENPVSRGKARGR